MMDLWWNPSVEQQAYDRVHRIGQTKPGFLIFPNIKILCLVFIHRLLIKDSFEYKVLLKQNSKKQLAENLLRNSHQDKKNKFALSFNDFKELFS